MSVHLSSIATKATIVAFSSLAVTLGVAKVATIYFGGSLTGTGLLLCIVCPLVIAGPASAWQFYQQARLKIAHDELGAAKAALEKVYLDLQRTYGQLHERARRDGLTGILNREGFVRALEQARESQAGTLFILDADHFKRINDRYGHPTGDEALRALVSAVKGCLEEGDVFGRIGGEEFAIFKPAVHGSAAYEAAERMRLAVRGAPIPFGMGSSLHLSISIGGADSRDFDHLDNLWRAADARLYTAKAAGRDRSVLDDPRGQGSPVEDGAGPKDAPSGFGHLVSVHPGRMAGGISAADS